MILDVGCGNFKRGDIGVDKEALLGVDVKLDLDAMPLPFADNSFNLVLSHHNIEHLQHPEFVIKEMLRVSNGYVRITCPHRFSEYAKITKDHRQFLNKQWFLQLAKRLNVEVNVKTTFAPMLYFGPVGLFMRPDELIVELKKKATE